jgi:hypothetical protein
VKPKVLEILQAGRDSLQSEIREVDTVIEQAAAIHGRENPAVSILLLGRDRLQAQIDELDQTINRVRLAAEGKEPQPSTTKAIVPGQYSGMKLSTAVQAYLSERGRGPISCAKVVEDLVAGGFKVNPTRSKYAKEPRLPNTRDLRLLAANNTKRYDYDSVADSLRMVPATGNDTGWKRRRQPRTATATASEE